MNKVKDAVVHINRLVTAAGLNDAQRLIQLENIARNVGEQVQTVDNSYRNLTRKFEDSLQSWRSHLEASMERTVGLQESFFQQADTSMARVCSDLLRSADALLAASENT